MNACFYETEEGKKDILTSLTIQRLNHLKKKKAILIKSAEAEKSNFPKQRPRMKTPGLPFP